MRWIASLTLAFSLLATGCRKDEPPVPTSEQSDQLNDADQMLNTVANEEGPDDRSPGPYNTQ